MKRWADTLRQESLQGGSSNRCPQQRRMYNFLCQQVPTMRQAMEDWTAKNLRGGAATTTSIIKETTDIIAKTQLLHLRKKQISSIVVDSGLSGGQEQNKTLKLLQEHHELNTELQSNPTVKAIQAGEYKNVSRVVTRKGEKATGFYGLIVSVLSALKRTSWL